MRSKRRWGDNNKHYGPLTVSVGGNPSYGMMLDSGAGDDGNDGCHLRIYAGRTTLLLELPNIVPDYRVKHMATSWDAATIERMGRDYYFESFRRETGFTAPGKDMLALSFADEDYERRRMEAWDAWSKAPFDDLRAALRTPRPEDARDAARYRWLRDRMSLEDIPEEHPDWSTPDEMESARIDAAIDAALTQPEAK